jgi:hypothetical protein
MQCNTVYVTLSKPQPGTWKTSKVARLQQLTFFAAAQTKKELNESLKCEVAPLWCDALLLTLSSMHACTHTRFYLMPCMHGGVADDNGRREELCVPARVSMWQIEVVFFFRLTVSVLCLFLATAWRNLFCRQQTINWPHTKQRFWFALFATWQQKKERRAIAASNANTILS